MKVFLATFSLVCFALVGFGQNLIPNPGFEAFTSLPTDLGQFSLCNSWGNAQSSDANPDYYHNNGSLLADLPVTSASNVSAYDGQAIMGFTATGKSGSNFREYLSVKINSPLIIGNRYAMSFRITNGAVYNHALAGLGVDKIGVVPSISELSQTAYQPLTEAPVYETSEIIYSREWEIIRFSFIATENSEYLTIGVFGDDSDKDIQFQEGNVSIAELAYYFIDDVTLINIPLENLAEESIKDTKLDFAQAVPVDSEFPFFVPNAFTPDGNGNNDVFNIIPGNRGAVYNVFVFDRWGNKIYFAENGKPEWDGKCNGSLCPSDIYVWVIKYKAVNEFGETVSKEETGTIHLIR